MLASLAPIDGVKVADTPLVFADIYQQDTDFVIWHRTLSDELDNAIARLLTSRHRFTYRIVIRPDEVADWLAEKWQGESVAALQNDVQRLVTLFADLFDLSHVGMRLEAVDKTLCPLFHVDKVMARLVTTYSGQGTEWLAEDSIDRQALANRDHEHVMRDERGLTSAEVGDVLLFKGQAWPDEEVEGVVHRSAQATAINRRLLLTLDVV